MATNFFIHRLMFFVLSRFLFLDTEDSRFSLLPLVSWPPVWWSHIRAYTLTVNFSLEIKSTEQNPLFTHNRLYCCVIWSHTLRTMCLNVYFSSPFLIVFTLNCHESKTLWGEYVKSVPSMKCRSFEFRFPEYSIFVPWTIPYNLQVLQNSLKLYTFLSYFIHVRKTFLRPSLSLSLSRSHTQYCSTTVSIFQ